MQRDCERLSIGHVAGQHDNLGTVRTNLRQRFFDFWRRAAARKQSNSARPFLRKPVGHLQPQRTCATGNQIRAVATNKFRSVKSFWNATLATANLRLEPRCSTLNRHHHLADILPLRHVAKRVDRLLSFEPREHQRPVVAGLEVSHHFGKQFADVVGPLAQHAIQVDREIRQVVLERQQADHAVLIDVGLADFQEAAVGPQNRQALGDRLAGQRIQHDIDAFPIRVGENFVGKRTSRLL